jgi:cytoskeletal protein CcmA (bactofilin family)
MIHGRLTGQGELAIDGRVEGDLQVEGEIHLGSSGVVLAAVEADVVTVAGHLRGNVVATTEVAVRDGGRIEGDVRAPRVAIDDGGALHGGIEMDFDLPSREDE